MNFVDAKIAKRISRVKVASPIADRGLRYLTGTGKVGLLQKTKAREEAEQTQERQA